MTAEAAVAEIGANEVDEMVDDAVVVAKLLVPNVGDGVEVGVAPAVAFGN